MKAQQQVAHTGCKVKFKKKSLRRVQTLILWSCFVHPFIKSLINNVMDIAMRLLLQMRM